MTPKQRVLLLDALNNNAFGFPSPNLTKAERDELQSLMESGREDDAWGKYEYKYKCQVAERKALTLAFFNLARNTAEHSNVHEHEVRMRADKELPKSKLSAPQHNALVLLNQKIGASKVAAAKLPAGVPTQTIVQKFKLTEAWASKLTHIKTHPFLREALMREGCRKKGKMPMMTHLWNPVVLAEILISRDGRNRRAMEAIITNKFPDWQDAWYEFLATDETDEFSA